MNVPPPTLFLIVGAFSLLYGLFCLIKEKVPTRSRWVYRAEEPRTFWLLTASCFLIGMLFMAAYCVGITA
jgi:hypothetical protein